MLLPVEWLKEYINIEEDTKTLADKLTLSGSHVESIISLDRGIRNVVVGKILKIEKHPNADKLLITSVDIGDETLQIVTGATNLKEGDYVPVALIGAKLLDGTYIDKTNFRGVDSYGMLCSLRELGFSDNIIPKYQRDGIFVLNGNYTLGDDINRVLNLKDEILELEITPNRSDCLSIVGMAREVAATFNEKLNIPKIEVLSEKGDLKDYINSVKVDEKLCNRYYIRVIKDVRIEESPLWLQLRLMKAGVRPINNIVDITNYVMLEYGQPLHAYDVEKLKGNRIYVRQAKEGEKVKTIDGAERFLKSSNLVIADDEGAIGIAGVMGGIDTEVTEETTTVLLESANFDSKSIRITSKEFGLRTEASARFEKGIDPNLCEIAAERVCQLIEKIGVGTVVEGNIDVFKNPVDQKIIQLRPNRVNKLLGTKLSLKDMSEYLERLELNVVKKGDNLEVIIPSFRLDLNSEVDLIEEIGRLYGFHNIETKPLVGVLTRGKKPYGKIIENKAKAILQGLGLNEVLTYSFGSPRVYDKLKIAEDSPLRNYIKIMNPLGEEYSAMRTTLIPNILTLLSRNYNYGVKECFVYEIGNVFIPKELPIKDLPIEKKMLSIGMYGCGDFYDIKEVIEILLGRLGIRDIEFSREENNPTFHPNRTAKISYKEQPLGVVGEIHIDVMENFDIKERVYIAYLDFDMIIEEAVLEKKYKPLPKYPAIMRDIAVVVDRDVLVGEIEKIIWENGEGLVEDVQLFDIYEGDQIMKGKKSIAFSITYRSYDRTLKDDEVNRIQDNIIKDLENKFDAKLRS